MVDSLQETKGRQTMLDKDTCDRLEAAYLNIYPQAVKYSFNGNEYLASCEEIARLNTRHIKKGMVHIQQLRKDLAI